MLNQYGRSAVAESNEGIGALAAENAAEQQPSLPDEMSTAQMLYSVVAHNVANPDKRIALSPEQSKEIMKDFVDSVAGSNEPPTTEDGRIKTFGEMDDNELLKCLSEYLGSGASNSSINGTIIETAQEMIAEQYMTEEELEDLPDPKTPRGKELRDRKLLEKMRDAAEEMERQLKENRDKWDKDTHDYGGEQLTGAEIMERINWFAKKENQEKVRNELIKEGKSDKEADEIIAKKKERDELYKRQRDGRPPLTPQEQARLDMLNKDKDVIRADKIQKEKMIDKSIELTQQNAQTKISESMADQYDLYQKRKSMLLTADEQDRLKKYEGDKSLQASNNLIDQSLASISSERRNTEAYETFSSAPHVKEAFVVASVQTSIENKPSPTSEKSLERPVITAAKVDASVAAFT